ncbi:MAG: phosphoribosylanthranilate isomerase [Acetobacteraceae bacterium]
MTEANAVRVKVCGINSEAAFDAAIGAGADWVGFVFFPPSPRFVTPARAAEISKRFAGGPPRVGLFVSPTEAEIAAALAEVPLDILQIYGPGWNAETLRRRFGLALWRAVGVAAKADLPRAAGGWDALLIEAKAPPDATRPGGNSLCFDWALIAGWAPPAPWLLAGGLNPENVARAIEATGASAVDVSSGVERAPGIKDPELIRAFVARARGASG